MVNGFREAGRWALGAGRWALGAGRWALGAGRWALGAGRFRALVPLLLSLFLLSAAFLKGYDLFTAPLLGTSLWTARTFRIVVIEAEWVLGLWLLSGLMPREARWVALAAFIAFFTVSLTKALTGEANCGCFGRVPISPRWTAAIDLAAILAVWLWPPAKTGEALERAATPRFRIVGVGMFFVLAGLPTGIVMATKSPAVLTAEGAILGDSRAVVLEPEGWVEKRLPLLDHISIGRELESGTWIILLYHRRCAACQRVIPTYERLAAETARRRHAARIALIEVPQKGDPRPESISTTSLCRRGRLSGDREWLVQTPLVLEMDDGCVTSVSRVSHGDGL